MTRKIYSPRQQQGDVRGDRRRAVGRARSRLGRGGLGAEHGQAARIHEQLVHGGAVVVAADEERR